MINYELARKLKEKGFKQHEEEDQINCTYKGCWKAGNTYGYEDCCNPTLEELIEACGDKFDRLINGGAYGWFADAKPDENKNVYTSSGSTPEEAVANLWLSLQK